MRGASGSGPRTPPAARLRRPGLGPRSRRSRPPSRLGPSPSTPWPAGRSSGSPRSAPAPLRPPARSATGSRLGLPPAGRPGRSPRGDPSACLEEASRALREARPWLLRTAPAALAGWAAGAACAALDREEEAASWRAWLCAAPFRGASARVAAAAAESLGGAAPARPPPRPPPRAGPEPSLVLRAALRALLGVAVWAACVFAASGVLFFSTSHPITDVPISKGVRYGVRIGGGDKAPSADDDARRVALARRRPVGEGEGCFVSEPLLELESDDALARVFFLGRGSDPDRGPASTCRGSEKTAASTSRRG